MKLTGKQRRYLRSLGHHLKPTVMLGKAGMTSGVLEQVETALEDHELIKLRFARSFTDDSAEVLSAILESSGAALAGRVGGTALLYRPRKEEPAIRLPETGET